MSVANVAVPKNIAGSLIQSLLSSMERFPLISVGFHSCSSKKRVREFFYVSISEKNQIETHHVHQHTVGRKSCGIQC